MADNLKSAPLSWKWARFLRKYSTLLLLFRVTALYGEDDPTQPVTPEWQYGGFIDLGYSLDFNHPENGVFRSRGATWHVDEVDFNMAGAYVKKKASDMSRWGAELLEDVNK
jgi:hypothetical protein